MKIFAASLLALLLGGCYAPAPTGTLLILGDSITVSLSAHLASTIVARDSAPLVINNTIGGMTASQDDSVQYWVGRIQAANAGEAIVSLGGNDAGRLKEEVYATLYPALVEIMQAFDGADVYWLIHQEGSIPALAEFRRAVMDAAAGFDNVRVMHMPLGVLGDDGVHLTPDSVEGVSNFILKIIGYVT